MLLTMVTYALFSELRTLAGLAIVNLTASTFLFQLTFMVGMRASVHASHPQACLATAVLVHYEALASFMWTNVMACDLYLALGRWTATGRRPVYKLLGRYAAYAYGIPFIIVGCALAMDRCDCCSRLRVDYGRYMCWIGDPYGNVVFFAIPIAAALVANALLFAATVVRIRGAAWRQRKGSDSYRSVKAIGQLRVYAKMSSVMGFAWLFGFISAGLGGEASLAGLVFAYAYAVLNPLAGVFIFIAFTCNGRVRTLYANRFSAWSNRTRPNTSGQHGKSTPPIFTIQ